MSHRNLGKVWTGIEARVVSVCLIILCGKILRDIMYTNVWDWPSNTL